MPFHDSEMTTKTYDNRILLGEISDMLAQGGEVILRAKGFSMEPFIRSELDSVRLCKPETVNVGDIVLACLEGESYVLHRVFAVEGGRVTLMGDGNVRGKEHCLLSDVKGKVKTIVSPTGRERVPGKGRVWRWLMPVRRYILGVYRRVYRRKYRKEFYRNET